MRLKIGSTYQKAVTIIEKLKEGNASIFICGKSGTGKTTRSSNIIRNLLEAGVRIVVIDHRHAVSLPADLEPYVHRQDVFQKPIKLHLFGTSANPADPLHLSLIRLHPLSGYQMGKSRYCYPY